MEIAILFRVRGSGAYLAAHGTSLPLMTGLWSGLYFGYIESLN